MKSLRVISILPFLLPFAAHANLVGLWEFDDELDIGKATVGTDLQINGTAPAWAASVPYGDITLSGVITTVQGVANGITATHGIGANGGGTRTNEYTILFDVSRPNSTQWRTFWQTNLANSDDADFFVRGAGGTVNSIGRTGTGNPGYTTGTLAADTWQRLVVTVKNGSFFRAYLNGSLMAGGNMSIPPLDNASNSLDVSQIRLFTDNDGENHPLVIGAAAMYSRALTADEVAELGTAGGAYEVETIKAITWTGAESSEWSEAVIPGGKNWVLSGEGGSPADFENGDTVRFDDSAVTTTIAINGADVTPGDMVFDHSTNDFILSGTHGIAGEALFTKSGTRTLTLAAPNSFSGTANLTSGVMVIDHPLALQNAALTSTGAANLDFGDVTTAHIGALSGGLSLLLESSSSTELELTLGRSTGTSTHSALIYGEGALTKVGASTQALASFNEFTGGTTLSGGVLRMDNPAALGTGDISHAGGQLTFSMGNGSDAEVTNNIALNETGHATFKIRGSAGAAPTLLTTVTLSGKLSGGAADQIYRLVDSDTGLNHNNILRLTNEDNDFAGTVEIWRGFLAFTSDAALGNPANGLRVEANNGNGGLRFDADGIVLAETRTITLPTTNSLEGFIVPSGKSMIAGPIVGAGAMLKQGEGELVVQSAANTFTGNITVNGGKLTVNGNIAASENAVTVNTAGTLSGSGEISRNLTLNGTLAPGDGVGELTVSNPATFNPSSEYVVEIGDWTGAAGEGHDAFTASAVVISATEELPLALRIQALDLQNFENESRDFVIASAAGGITGFDPAAIQIDASELPSATGTWSVALANDGKDLVLKHTVGDGTSYGDWALLHAGGGLPNEDSNGDGVSNGVAYFMGITGRTTNPGIIGSTITWPKDPDALATYAVQTSTNMAAEGEPGGWTNADIGVTDHGTSVSFALPDGEGKLFVRLKVIVTP